ncbi:MAG: hypothetical protein IJU50_00770 [Lachnospiraceae bacterium]|nr:hypothetical protein [Lachnospiraceae bacterium]
MAAIIIKSELLENSEYEGKTIGEPIPGWVKPEQEIVLEESEELNSEKKEIDEEQLRPVPQQDYFPPEYDFTDPELLEEVFVHLPVSREYILLWVSDTHMITDLEAGQGVKKSEVSFLKKRRNTLPVDKNGLHSDELWPQIIGFINYAYPDGVIFGGDIMDYCSVKNADTVRAGLEQIDPNIPFLYLRADHDYGNWYGDEDFTMGYTKSLHRKLPGGDGKEEKFLDFGEFLVLGVNESTTKKMPQDQYEWLTGRLDQAAGEGKPVILATHVPYASTMDPSLEELSRKVRGEIYYWGSTDPESRFIPEGNTWEFMLKVYGMGDTIRQVLGGHLHASWDGELTEGIPEHIFGSAFEGRLGIVHVLPEGAEEITFVEERVKASYPIF